MAYVYGYNGDVDTGTATTGHETVWPGGGLWVPPTVARVHAIVSGSADDDGAPAGAGAQSVIVSGYIADWVRASEVVVLNGVGAVNTTKSYLHIESLEVNLGAVNVGAITATAATDTTVTCQIPATYGVSNGCVLGCGAGQHRHITGASVSAGVAATGDFAAFLDVRLVGTTRWHRTPLFGLLDAGSTGGLYGLDVWLGPGDFARLSVQSSADNQVVHGALKYE